MYKIFVLTLAIFFSGCAVSKVDKNYQEILLDESQTIQIDKEWWLGYNEDYLNELIDTALKNNIDLKKSAITINKALAQAGIISADLLPNFNASLKGEASRDIGSNSQWQERFSTSISVSYELDLWQKLRNSKDAAMWEVNATQWDLQATKLSLINSVASGYFNAIYLKNAIKLYKQTLQNYEMLGRIIDSKVSFGKDEQISQKQVQSQILSIKNRILQTQKNLDTIKQTLKNLLNERGDFEFKFKEIFETKPLGVDIEVPIFSLSNRPDLKASIARINEALLNVKVSEKNFYPSLSIGASLSDSDEKLKKSFSLNLLNGNIALNLPFLNYSRLKANLRVSEASFQSAKLEYISRLTTAINEVYGAYKELENDKILLNNFMEQAKNYAQISKIYKLKYDYGKVELKEHLNAKNSELEAAISVLEQKYKIINNEINIFKAMAGRVQK
ncbi:TolC family protein [Campylobacter suis]|uniref:Toxin and drug export protein A n=1 Tax=Campylobacter suis TaxID=2790657 RepID=A0ABN7K2W6_9BACT|nr:TolC family protein [Campylobacter suis]CAD7286797.1 Toxin and drug export protein A [Campylobacter suis]